MALKIEELRLHLPSGDYISPARVCLTADDELVDCTDPRAVSLLVGKGAPLPRAEAERYGLIVGTDSRPSTPADAADDPMLVGTVAEVKERIAACDDVEILAALAEAEGRSPKPRKGVLAAIEARRAEIGEADGGDTDGDDDEADDDSDDSDDGGTGEE